MNFTPKRDIKFNKTNSFATREAELKFMVKAISAVRKDVFPFAYYDDQVAAR